MEQTPVTIVLLIVTIAFSFYAWNNAEVYHKYIMNPYLVNTRKQYYRILTSGFMHADYMHLGFNMYAFYLFGRIVEYSMDSIILFSLLYLSAIVVSGIPSYIKHRNAPHYNSLGASGGVSAVIFASILLAPEIEIGLFLIPFYIPGYIFGPLYLLYSAYMSKRGTDNINHDAHFYGAVYGFVFAAVTVESAIPDFLHKVFGI